MKILSQYPSNYPEELQRQPPLISHFISQSEAKLLTWINRVQCNNQFGSEQFITSDLIVELKDLTDLFCEVQKHFPNVNSEHKHQVACSTGCDGGWVQVNNTVVPFIYRHPYKFVSLHVIRHAAGLLQDVQVPNDNITCEECVFFIATTYLSEIPQECAC